MMLDTLMRSSLNNKSNFSITIDDVYEFRKFNRETYLKADLVGDLSGSLLAVRNITGVNISVDVNRFLVILEDTNLETVQKSIVEVDRVLKNFLRRYSYMSSLPDEKADKYEIYLNTFSVFDVMQVGNCAKISF